MISANQMFTPSGCRDKKEEVYALFFYTYLVADIGDLDI